MKTSAEPNRSGAFRVPRRLTSVVPGVPAGAYGIAVAAALALVVRRRWARRLAHETHGTLPGVRTDDGVLLHTVTDGSPDAPITMVFAHGLASRAQEYDAQREALRERSRMVLFDQRGHGQSGWRGHQALSIDRLGRDLGQVIDEATGNAPVVLVAHSMGGMGAFALAEQRPELFSEKIVGVALLSTSAGGLARVAPVGARVAVRSGIGIGLLWWMWFIAPAVDAVRPFHSRRGRHWLRRRLFGVQEPPELALSIAQDMAEKTQQSMVAACYPSMILFEKSHVLPVFARVPTLVLAGTDDATIPAGRSEQMAEQIGRSARLVLVPGAGHMVNMTHPDAVNAALLDLLDRASAGHSSPQRAPATVGNTMAD